MYLSSSLGCLPLSIYLPVYVSVCLSAVPSLFSGCLHREDLHQLRPLSLSCFLSFCIRPRFFACFRITDSFARARAMPSCHETTCGNFVFNFLLTSSGISPPRLSSLFPSFAFLVFLLLLSINSALSSPPFLRGICIPSDRTPQRLLLSSRPLFGIVFSPVDLHLSLRGYASLYIHAYLSVCISLAMYMSLSMCMYIHLSGWLSFCPCLFFLYVWRGFFLSVGWLGGALQHCASLALLAGCF